MMRVYEHKIERRKAIQQGFEFGRLSTDALEGRARVESHVLVIEGRRMSIATANSSGKNRFNSSTVATKDPPWRTPISIYDRTCRPDS